MIEDRQAIVHKGVIYLCRRLAVSRPDWWTATERELDIKHDGQDDGEGAAPGA
ncbi:hypothetical protein [Streptomyces sp. NPDC002082]|uniref:hypothetical protein n=1 Tax=Streptomyces sp. NPDC002082 TaxID=3154772 RepID=UPI00332C0872